MRWYFCVKATKPLQPTREISFLKKALIFHSFTLHWTIKKPMVTRGLIKESMKEGLRGKYARTSEESSKPKILLIWYHDPGSFLDQCNAFHKSLWNPIEAQISNETVSFLAKKSIMASSLIFANLFHVLKLALIAQVLLCSFVLTRPYEVQKQIIGMNLASWWHFCL